MPLSPKAASLAAGLVAALGVAAVAQNPARQAQAPRAGSAESIVVDGIVDWLEKSDVSPLREGVLDKVEFHVGKKVESNGVIAILHDTTARLTMAKAKRAAENTGEIAKGEAQRAYADAALARLRRLQTRDKTYVSVDEFEKAAAEVKVAEAAIQAAQETQKLNEADLDLAKQAVEEHQIRAPFTGVITDRMKNPGEAIRANEPVVRLARTDRVKFAGWVPLKDALLVRENDPVELRIIIDGADLPIERVKYRGKVIAVSRDLNNVNVRGGGVEAQVLAEIENPDNAEHPELELRKGLKGEMLIHPAGAAKADNAALGARLPNGGPR